MQATAPLLNGGWDALDLELYRSRRFGRPFTLVGVRLPTGSPAGESDLTYIASHLRMTDSVWSNKRLLYFLLPEADREDAEGFLARIEHVTALTAHGDAQIAVFPDDGLTKDALLVAATVPCEDPKATIAGAAAERAVRSRRGLRHLVAAAATAVGSSAERAAGSAEEA